MRRIDQHPCTVAPFIGHPCFANIFDSMTELADYADKNGTHRNAGGSWYGDADGKKLSRLARDGDLSRVAGSDALMSKFESIALDTHLLRWTDAMAGGFPNVPAYLAGAPLTMRSRRRDASAAAPLCVVSDTTVSAGMDKRHIERRGAAILALVRLLSSSRPVELWTLCATDARERGACFHLVRIETSPLDLARAAFALTHPGYPRGLQYEIGRPDGYTGAWPFKDYTNSRAKLRELLTPYLPHATGLLAIPGAHFDDPIVSDPEAWLRKALDEFGPQLEAA